nr:ABC transporter permease [Haliscomenobacter sp.]
MIKGDTKKTVLSDSIDEYFIGVYTAYKFVIRFFKEVFVPPFHFRAVVTQSYEIGIKSLALISVTGFIIGIVFTKQSRPSLEDFGAASWLPNLVGIAIIRALGPVLTALICAGKVGSSIGAELSSMKVTEQIEAMEVSAINPFKYPGSYTGSCGHHHDSLAGNVLHFYRTNRFLYQRSRRRNDQLHHFF